MTKKVNKLIQWWMTSRLPIVHIYIPKNNRPKGIRNIVRVYFRKWFVHPIKRRIAKYYLIILRKFFGLKVIGITGSSGKTTTKEMLVSILKQKGETVASFANIDPVYNIPTTILKCRLSTKFLVLEMGIEYPNEMDFYLWLAKPDIGVITNIYPTHTEFFGNEEGVAKEKGKLVKALSSNEIAILNKSNIYLKAIGEKISSKVIWFGKNTNIKAEKVRILGNLQTEFTLIIDRSKLTVHIPIIGSQFVENALAASAVAFALGFSIDKIKTGLENYKKPEHRMEFLKLKSGAILIDDAYNNNPVAAQQALKTFKSIVGKRKSVVVFGDMLELGDLEKKAHLEIGKLIKKQKFDYLIGVGNRSKWVVDEAKKGVKKVFWVEEQGEVLSILKKLIKRDSIILIKGSRSIGLENVVSKLITTDVLE